MNSLLIIGAGGHGKVVADAALACARWKRVAFLDDRAAELHSVLGLPVLGGIADLEKHANEFAEAVVAIGDAAHRMELLAVCARLGYRLPVVAHPAATVSQFATLGVGCVVFAQAAINAGVQMGAGCIVNTGATVDHDCSLDDGVHVCPGVHIAGSVRVGRGAWIGIGATVREGVVIGSEVTVGAGAVVIGNVKDNATVCGIPARPRNPS